MTDASADTPSVVDRTRPVEAGDPVVAVYFLDRVAGSILELYNGKFFSHAGNYTDYLLAKAERQEADAPAEEHQLLGLLEADVAGEQVGRAAVRDEAAAHEHLDEAGVLGGDRTPRNEPDPEEHPACRRRPADALSGGADHHRDWFA